MARHKVTDAGGRPAGYPLDIVGQTIVTIGGMEPGYSLHMMGNMVRQIAPAQLLVPPDFQGHIDIGDGFTECGGIFRGQALHVLRPGTGQLVNLAEVSGGICQDDCGDFRHIPGVNRRRAPGAEGEPYRAVPGDGFSSPGQEEGILEEYRGAQMDDGQSGPVQHLLGQPVLPLLG